MSRGRSRSLLPSASSLKRLPWESTPTRCTSAGLCFKVGEMRTGTLWLCGPTVEVFDGEGQPSLSSCPSLHRVWVSDSASPPTPGALTPPDVPRGSSLALGLSRICAVPSSNFFSRASVGRAAPFSGCEAVEAVRSKVGLLRFLGNVSAMRSKSGRPADMEDVEFERGKGFAPPSPESSVAEGFPVRNPRVFLIRRGVKKPARPAQLLLLPTCEEVAPDEFDPDGFCPNVAPQQRDWTWFPSPWDGENPRPSVWGNGGWAPKLVAGSYFLWGCVSISRKELLLLGGTGRLCWGWDEDDDMDFFFMKELKKPALRSRVKLASNGSSSRLEGDLSLCLRGRAGELLVRPSPARRVAARPKHKTARIRSDWQEKDNRPSKITAEYGWE